jgi:hypothetical protein
MSKRKAIKKALAYCAGTGAALGMVYVILVATGNDSLAGRVYNRRVEDHTEFVGHEV